MVKSPPFRLISRLRRTAETRSTTRRHLQLESLEERMVMSTVTVTLGTDPLRSHAGISLRDAITLVDSGKASTIAFNIPGPGAKTIAVSTPLPTITRPVTIDGTTEPGYAGKPLVALTRTDNTVKLDGLLITAGSSTVRGLAIYGFARYGLHLETGGTNTIAADYLGVTTTGVTAAGNNAGGLWLDSSSGNTIGGTTTTARNLISSNGGEGIRLDGGSTGNTIVGNSIGTDLTGNLNLGNQSDGIAIVKSGGVTANRIVNNVVANNQHYGIGLDTSTNVLIQGNLITNSEHRGLAIINSSQVTVGGTTSAAANTITANGLRDQDAGSMAAGVAVVNGSSNVIVIGNTIKGNGRGLRVSGAGVAGLTPSVTITNNLITGNSTQGVLIDDFFGGPSQNVQLTGNTISSNLGDGVQVGKGSRGVTLPSGNKLISNTGWGIEIFSATVDLPSTTSNTITGNKAGNLRKKV